ncbi:hypothetical protein AMTRI_Chr01g126670 [Amborella trichopoda]
MKGRGSEKIRNLGEEVRPARVHRKRRKRDEKEIEERQRSEKGNDERERNGGVLLPSMRNSYILKENGVVVSRYFELKTKGSEKKLSVFTAAEKAGCPVCPLYSEKQNPHLRLGEYCNMNMGKRVSSEVMIRSLGKEGKAAMRKRDERKIKERERSEKGNDETERNEGGLLPAKRKSYVLKENGVVVSPYFEPNIKHSEPKQKKSAVLQHLRQKEDCGVDMEKRASSKTKKKSSWKIGNLREEAKAARVPPNMRKRDGRDIKEKKRSETENDDGVMNDMVLLPLMSKSYIVKTNGVVVSRYFEPKKVDCSVDMEQRASSQTKKKSSRKIGNLGKEVKAARVPPKMRKRDGRDIKAKKSSEKGNDDEVMNDKVLLPLMSKSYIVKTNGVVVSRYFEPKVKNSKPKQKKLAIKKSEQKQKKSVVLSRAEMLKEAYKRKTADNNWVPPPSPFGLMQEKYYNDPWKVLVICMFLNKTSGNQAREVLSDFLKLCPDAKATTEIATEEITRVTHSLGLQRKRAEILQRFSREYLDDHWTHVTQLYGIGKTVGSHTSRFF